MAKPIKIISYHHIPDKELEKEQDMGEAKSKEEGKFCK